MVALREGWVDGVASQLCFLTGSLRKLYIPT
jgi:hypothetical protein